MTAKRIQILHVYVVYCIACIRRVVHACMLKSVKKKSYLREIFIVCDCNTLLIARRRFIIFSNLNFRETLEILTHRISNIFF